MARSTAGASLASHRRRRIWLAALVVLSLVALLTTLAPAVRASRTAPAEALRYQ